jgi:hypothetical protein
VTPRCATCKHWTPVIVDDEVVADVMGTCRESPAKLGKAADEWCGRWSPNATEAAGPMLWPTPPCAMRPDPEYAAMATRLAWAHSQSAYRGMGAAYPMTVDITPDAPRPWWRRIFR